MIQLIVLFRKYVGSLIDLADDAADTEYDEDVSQIMLYGGIYLSPADALKLCTGCRKLVDVVWKSGHEPASCPPSLSVSSAA